MITCSSAVSSPSLNEAWTRFSSMKTESSGPSVLDSCSRYCVIRPRLTMITSSWPGCRWKSWPPPGSSVTSITTSCCAPVLGYVRQPTSPQSNCSCSMSVCLMNFPMSPLPPGRWFSGGDRLEAAHVLGHRSFGRQPLHAGRAEEADHAGGACQHVSGVIRLCDRPSVAQHDHLGVDRLRAVVHLLNKRHALVQGAGGMRPDRPLGRKPHMRDKHVGAGARHRLGPLDVEYIGGGQQPALVREADHLHLELVAHARLLEVGAKGPVDQADGREVLNTGKTGRVDLPQKAVHQPEGVGPADSRQH